MFDGRHRAWAANELGLKKAPVVDVTGFWKGVLGGKSTMGVRVVPLFHGTLLKRALGAAQAHGGAIGWTRPLLCALKILASKLE